MDIQGLSFKDLFWFPFMCLDFMSSPHWKDQRISEAAYEFEMFLTLNYISSSFNRKLKTGQQSVTGNMPRIALWVVVIL